jgi:hypothetical protein
MEREPRLPIRLLIVSVFASRVHTGGAARGGTACRIVTLPVLHRSVPHGSPGA